MRIIFPSVSRANIYYLIDGKMAYDRGLDRRPSAVEWARWYDTMGDGCTQHAPDEPIAKQDLADFCISLATHLQTEPADIEAVAKHYHYSDAYRPEIEFYASIKYQEDKPQYFHRGDHKVSRAASKQHDKRWEKVDPWMNGSVGAIWGLHCNGRGRDLLTNFITLEDIIVMTNGWGNVETFFDLPPNTETAVHALHYLMEARRYQTWADRALENYTQRLHQQSAA